MTNQLSNHRDGKKRVVLKFGSSVLYDVASIDVAVGEIAVWVRKGYSVITVVSALGDTTDHLMKTMNAITRSPCHTAAASVLASGEDAAAALLAVALRKENTSCVVARSELFRVVTRGQPLDAFPVHADTAWLVTQFQHVDVVVVPGFVGRCEAGEPTVMGRGGSDLSALFLAAQVGATECRLVKDVDGLFAWDPNDLDRPRPPRFRHVDWGLAEELGGDLVQPKAIRFAEERAQSFTVIAIGGKGTRVGIGVVEYDEEDIAPATGIQR